MFTLLLLNGLAALLADAALATVVQHLVADAGGLVALRADQHDLADVQRGLLAQDAALLAGLAGLAVTYLLGAVYGCFVMRLVLTKEVTLWFIVWNWCLVYLPVDAVKLAAALAISPVLNSAIASASRKS